MHITTNTCEIFQSKLNNLCTSPEPNILVFVKYLLAIETDTYIILQNTSVDKTCTFDTLEIEIKTCNIKRYISEEMSQNEHKTENKSRLH